MNWTGKIFGLARWMWALIVIGVLIAGAWFIIATISGGKSAQTKADLNSERAGAAIESGQDAANTIGDLGDSAAETDGKVRNAQDEIDNAESGAAIDAAGRDGLCDIAPDYC